MTDILLLGGESVSELKQSLIKRILEMDDAALVLLSGDVAATPVVVAEAPMTVRPAFPHQHVITSSDPTSTPESRGEEELIFDKFVNGAVHARFSEFGFHYVPARTYRGELLEELLSDGRSADKSQVHKVLDALQPGEEVAVGMTVVPAGVRTTQYRGYERLANRGFMIMRSRDDVVSEMQARPDVKGNITVDRPTVLLLRKKS